jgi:hypothetical protein
MTTLDFLSSIYSPLTRTEEQRLAQICKDNPIGSKEFSEAYHKLWCSITRIIIKYITPLYVWYADAVVADFVSDFYIRLSRSTKSSYIPGKYRYGCFFKLNYLSFRNENLYHRHLKEQKLFAFSMDDRDKDGNDVSDKIGSHSRNPRQEMIHKEDLIELEKACAKVQNKHTESVLRYFNTNTSLKTLADDAGCSIEVARLRRIKIWSEVRKEMEK